MVARPEEIAFRYGYITAQQLEETASAMKGNGYGPTCSSCSAKKCFRSSRQSSVFGLQHGTSSIKNFRFYWEPTTKNSFIHPSLLEPSIVVSQMSSVGNQT